MNILVIDREQLTNQLIASKLEAKGHHVTTEPNKNIAFEKMQDGAFDCIMVDPLPLSEARPVVMALWKHLTVPRPYLILLSKTATEEEAITAGTNDIFLKPLNSQDLETKMANAARFLAISNHLARIDNVHSTGGLVGKAAFNQLFLSALDRSFRYGERSLIVFVTMTNYADIIALDGEENTNITIQRLTEKMTYMRRQSDVIGRLGAHEFAILLQRPQYESEPLDALGRFSEDLEKFYHSFENRALAPKISLSLVELPQGALRAECTVPMGIVAAVGE